MMLDLWSRRRKRTQWMSFDTYMKSLPAEEQATIKEGARAILAKRKHRVRAMIWTRTGPDWCRRFFRGRGESRLRRRAQVRLRQAAEWRKRPRRKPTRLLRSKGWGARACPHLFGRDCLSSWKRYVEGDGKRIVTSLRKDGAAAPN